jgi:hypothetical protein
MALKETIKEFLYLNSIIKQLDIHNYFTTKSSNNYLFTDSQSAIDLANNPEHHFKTKHIDIQYHFVRENIINKAISLNYIPTKEQIADIFTKAVNTTDFKRLVGYLNLANS